MVLTELLPSGDMPLQRERGLLMGIWSHLQAQNRKELCFAWGTAESPLMKEWHGFCDW